MENFDSVTPPALPTGWAAVTALDCINSNPWATTTNNPDTAPNTTFVNDPNCISDEHLVSPPFPIISATAVLTFRHNFDMETGFDGGVIEVSTNGGTSFQDIIAAGGTFVGGTQGYNGTISVNFGSPIGGRMAFTGNSGGYVTTSINLPAGFNGQSMIVRWRRATDSSVSDVGWFVDTISVTGSNCAAQPCTITCPADVSVANDADQCGAVVNYPAPMTTGTVSRAGTLRGWFVMVRDTKNSHPGNRLWGDGWGWAWFDAANPSETTSTDYEVDCKGCHVPAEATEWVYVEGYPPLKR